MKIFLLIILTAIVVDFGIHVIYHAVNREYGINDDFLTPYRKIAERAEEKIEVKLTELEERDFEYVTGEKKEVKH